MKIGIPLEAGGETRVAATPETVAKLVAQGHTVLVEHGAGRLSALLDEAYAQAGASLVDTQAAWAADLVLKIRPPQAEDIPRLQRGAAVVALFNPYRYPHWQALAEQHVTSFALELIPRTTRAQTMDVLSSQANLAGYKAVLLATQYYPRFMPMLMTAAGTIKPAKVLVLGAGVAGLQAIATAKRLGAVVEAFDVRPATKEQVLSLGAKFVEVPLEEGETSGGDGVYAQEMSAAYKQRQAELIDQRARLADIIITTALIPGKPAPCLLPEATVRALKAGSVVVDMAIEAGGNCAGSQLNTVVQTAQGVTLVGWANIPGMLPCDASSLYARNVLQFLALVLPKDSAQLVLPSDDDIVDASLTTHQGRVLFPHPTPEAAV